MEDMDMTMSKLKEQTLGEEILGAVMFSCNGRGPQGKTVDRVFCFVCSFCCFLKLTGNAHRYSGQRGS